MAVSDQQFVSLRRVGLHAVFRHELRVGIPRGEEATSDPILRFGGGVGVFQEGSDSNRLGRVSRWESARDDCAQPKNRQGRCGNRRNLKEPRTRQTLAAFTKWLLYESPG